MRLKGIGYDIGINAWNLGENDKFDLSIAEKEISIIQNDLHCNAIRVIGTNEQNLEDVTRIALQHGLEVWMSPYVTELTRDVYKDYLVRCAVRAEKLRQEFPDGSIVLVAGGEFMFFMHGILPGKDTEDRLTRPGWYDYFATPEVSAKYREMVSDFADALRAVYHGKLSYAGLAFEPVDWTKFDYISLDHYKASYNAAMYTEPVKALAAYHVPIAILEVGLCTYAGAENDGSRGYAIISHGEDGMSVPGDYIRDEENQAKNLIAQLEELDNTNVVDSIFAFTFIWREYFTDETDPHKDLDLGSFGIVKPYKDRYGSIYPDLQWDPKKAFYALADYYKNK